MKNNMLLANELFNTIWDKAKDSVRHRIHFDLRDSENDDSQRMLNVLEIDTKIPIHRHRDTSEVVIILRGKVREVYFDNQGHHISLNMEALFPEFVFLKGCDILVNALSLVL